MLPYSERHFQRLDKLLQSSYLVEHTLASMQMLVGEDGAAAGDERDSRRPLARELKRLRDGRQRGREGGDVDEGESDDSDADSEDGGGAAATPVPDSEVVDGRVVFNVKVGGEIGGDGSDGDDDDEEDAVMGDVPGVVSPGGGAAASPEDGGGDSARKPKKRRKKKSAGGGLTPHLGLIGQPVVETESGEAEVEAEEAAGSSRKSRRKRNRSAGDPAAAPGAAIAPVQGQPAGAVVPEEEVAGVVGVGDEGKGSGKKKKRSGKGRRKCTTT